MADKTDVKRSTAVKAALVQSAKLLKAISKIQSAEGEGEREKLEKEKNPLEQQDRNLQYALTRLVNDEDERRAARTDGKGFQIKYDLSNDQMYTLCRLAIQIGFYSDTRDLERYLALYSQLPDEIKALTPSAARALKLGDGLGAPIGSCSCSCP